MHAAVLRVAFASPLEAQHAGRALAPDNAGHIAWRVEGAVLVLEAEAATVMGLVRTVDDALGCLRALEGANPQR